MSTKLLFAAFLGFVVYTCFVFSPRKSLPPEAITYPLFSVEEIQEDFDGLVLELEQNHAGIYRYQSEKQWKKHVLQCRSKLQKTLNLKEFYKIIHLLLRPVRCGHTRIRLPEGFLEEFEQQEIFFPIHFKWIEGKALVYYDFNNKPQLQKGDRILEINNRPIGAILDTLRNYLSGLSDGFNESGQLRFIEHYFASLYPIFLDDSGNFEVTYQTPHKKKTMLSHFKGVNLSKIHHLHDRDALQLHTLEAMKLAILKVSGFDTPHSIPDSLNFTRKIQRIFQKIRLEKSQFLILDLRGNSGGNLKNMAELLTFLMDKPFIIFNKIEPNSTQAKPLVSMPSLEDQFKSPISLNELRFKGQLYVLTDGMTFSAGSVTAALLQSHRPATLIGEESGGAFLGNNSGILSAYRLKNSGIRVRIPYWQFWTAVEKTPKNPHSGVIPDFPVEILEKDFLDDVDTVMKKAFALIKENQSPASFKK